MKANLDLAIKFANKAKNIKGVVQIVLFGSVVRGEDNRESDVDIAIVYTDEDKFEIMNAVNSYKPDKIQTTFINIKDLTKERELVGALSGEGLLLYGSPISIEVKKSGLSAKVLISYSLAGLRQTDKVKVNRALYGSVSKSEFKGKKYSSESRGLIKEEGIEKINDCVFLVDRRMSSKITGLLRRFNVEFKEIPIWVY